MKISPKSYIPKEESYIFLSLFTEFALILKHGN